MRPQSPRLISSWELQPWSTGSDKTSALDGPVRDDVAQVVAQFTENSHFLFLYRAAGLWDVVHTSNGTAAAPPVKCSLRFRVFRTGVVCSDEHGSWTGQPVEVYDTQKRLFQVSDAGGRVVREWGRQRGRHAQRDNAVSRGVRYGVGVCGVWHGVCGM